MERHFFARYDGVISMISPVDFYWLGETKNTNPLFSKEMAYEYQNELRMAFCELANDMFTINPDDKAGDIVPDLSPVKLQIGSIRDIAVAIPIDDFLELQTIPLAPVTNMFIYILLIWFCKYFPN